MAEKNLIIKYGTESIYIGNLLDELCLSTLNTYALHNLSFEVNFIYTITFNKLSGTGGTDLINAIYEQLLPTITPPTRTGHTFGGYYTSTSGSGTKYYNADGTSPKVCDFTDDITLYAKWTALTYTISYNANGGSGAPSAQTKTYGVTLTLSSTIPTMSGKVFLGWAESSTATLALYNAGGSFTKNADTTLYAVWTDAPSKVTVHIVGEGNSTNSYVTISGIKYTSGATVQVDPGTTMTCGVQGSNSNGFGSVTVNGTNVKTVTSGVQTYNYTINDNIDVFLGYRSTPDACGKVVIATVTGTGNVIPKIELKNHNNYVDLWFVIDSDGKIWGAGAGRNGGGSGTTTLTVTPALVSSLTVGTHTQSITISWSGDSNTQSISYTVENNSPLQSIAVTGTPAQQRIGNEIDPTGLVVRATLLDGTVLTVTDEVTWSAPSAYYSNNKWTKTGSSTIAATYVRSGVSKTSSNVNVTIVEAPAVTFATATKNGGNSATISFTVEDEPTAFMIGATANITVGSTTSKQITSVSGNGSGTNKANFVVYASYSRLVGCQTDNITTSYNNGQFTVTVTGCVFSNNIAYKLEYAYGSTPTISMGNATISSTTQATYSGLTEQPEVVMMQVMTTSNQSISTTGRLLYVIFHKDDTYGYGMYTIQSGSSWSATYQATYIANSYTCTYSNGTITIKPGSQQLFASTVSTEAIMCWMGSGDTPGPTPTEDYTYLLYILSNGTNAYLNTGVIVNNDALNWSIDYELVTPATTATTNASIMGAYISNGVNGLMRYDLWFTHSYGVMHKNSLLAISALDSGRHTVTTTGTTTKTVTVDGASAGTISGTKNFATGDFYVGAANGNGSADLFVAAKYYEITFTNSSTTTLHLLPCKENATNKIGMYDTVANRFIAGTGTWTAGPAV